MKQEDKELLIKDLCARLPYKQQVEILKDGTSITDKLTTATIKYLESGYWDVKPYLLPLSSMTDEENNKLGDELIELELKALSDEIDHSVPAAYEIDYYNSHHIDYRGLIEKGLAIDATGLNIY